jgi:hypothetical protein
VRTAAETVEANAAIGAYLSLMATAIERTLAEGNNPLLATMAAEFDAITIEGKPESVALSLAANLIDGFRRARCRQRHISAYSAIPLRRQRCGRTRSVSAPRSTRPADVVPGHRDTPLCAGRLCSTTCWSRPNRDCHAVGGRQSRSRYF